MNKRDLISGLFWAGLGIAFTVGGLENGLVRRGIPGPGCLPFIVGLILIFLSSLITVSALLCKREQAKSPPEKRNIRKVWLGIVSLFAYAVALTYIGFPVTTFLFMLFLLRAIEPQGWRTAVSWASLTAFLSWALFALLKVELPKGIVGI